MLTSTATVISVQSCCTRYSSTSLIAESGRGRKVFCVVRIGKERDAKTPMCECCIYNGQWLEQEALLTYIFDGKVQDRIPVGGKICLSELSWLRMSPMSKQLKFLLNIRLDEGWFTRKE